MDIATTQGIVFTPINAAVILLVAIVQTAIVSVIITGAVPAYVKYVPAVAVYRRAPDANPVSPVHVLMMTIIALQAKYVVTAYVKSVVMTVIAPLAMSAAMVNAKSVVMMVIAPLAKTAVMAIAVGQEKIQRAYLCSQLLMQRMVRSLILVHVRL